MSLWSSQMLEWYLLLSTTNNTPSVRDMQVTVCLLEELQGHKGPELLCVDETPHQFWCFKEMWDLCDTARHSGGRRHRYHCKDVQPCVTSSCWWSTVQVQTHQRHVTGRTGKTFCCWICHCWDLISTEPCGCTGYCQATSYPSASGVNTEWVWAESISLSATSPLLHRHVAHATVGSSQEMHCVPWV